MRSGYTCAAVTISQAAFMQPSKIKERRYSSLLSRPIPRRGSLQVPQPSYTQVERMEPDLPAQVVAAEVAADSVHPGVITRL